MKINIILAGFLSVIAFVYSMPVFAEQNGDIDNTMYELKQKISTSVKISLISKEKPNNCSISEKKEAFTLSQEASSSYFYLEHVSPIERSRYYNSSSYRDTINSIIISSSLMANKSIAIIMACYD